MTTNCYYAIEVATVEWDDAILSQEQVTAETTDLLAQELNQIYYYANQELEQLADDVTSIDPDDSHASDEINQAQTAYNQANQEYQNLENTFDAIVQGSETETSQLSQDEQQTIQFSSSIMQMMTFIASCLASG
ncbi:hypothetical protein [Simkania sp.]|uniref:hypothetical protein n=1 Tax=Simkania sp. TaxID=34094 RepID=UPI003B51D99F